MKANTKITVTYRNKEYHIDPDRIIEVIKKLTNEEIEYESEVQIRRYLKKLKLYDEIFLDYIQKL